MSETFSNIVDCASIDIDGWPQELHTRSHVFRADVGREDGSTDSAPSPHDYFDSALASCKALTALWYAKRRGIPLERVATRVERDDHAEREGKYRLRVHLDFQGTLTDEQRALLRRAADNCPIHKLMTRAEIEVETVD
ncbi:MAG TPA: OsmC family protein [Rhodanobacteraceae bacterium]|nr:OsmC family protein [Rhodanobacteraceae bacterium]